MPSANGVVMSSAPGMGRMCYRLLPCPGSTASAAEQLGAALASGAARAARSRKKQLGSPLQQQQQEHQQSSSRAAAAGAAAAISSRQKDYTVINVNTKIDVLIKGNTQKHKKKHLKNGAISI